MIAVLPQRKWTASEFLEWTLGQTGRFELESGHVIEMAAEQAKHALTKHAAAKALESGVLQAGLDCTVFPDGMTIVVDDSHVRLPDAAVQCGPIDPEATVLEKPIILVEVVSPSSIYRDENHKLLEYFSLPSVVHYLIVSPDQKLVVHFKRGPEAEKIETRFISDGLIELSPPGFSVSVAALLGADPYPSQSSPS